jgi:hypothetical protein
VVLWDIAAGRRAPERLEEHLAELLAGDPDGGPVRIAQPPTARA